MNRLVLLLGPRPDAPVRWAVGDGASLNAAGTVASLSALSGRLPPHDELACILPGETAATRRLRLPVGEREVEGAARLAFEDQLAEPASAFAFAWSPAQEGERLVTAIPHGDLASWMAAFAAAGIDPDLVTVDHAALAAEGHDGVVLRDHGRVTARLPSGGLTAPESFALPLIERLSNDASLLSVRIGPSGAEIGSESLVLADERALSAFYLASLDRGAAPNFRRGALAKRRKIASDLGAWRLAGGLMAACLLLWLAAGAVTGFRYQAAADRLRAEAEAEYREAFPESRIRDLRRQAERRAGGPQGSSFLPLSAALAGALEETGRVTLEGLTYTPRGELIADVRYADFGELQRLSDNLRARGVIASEGDTARRADDGAYEDRLTLTARGAS